MIEISNGLYLLGGFIIGAISFAIAYKYESGGFNEKEARYKLLISEAEEREANAKIELYKFESMVRERLKDFKEIMNRK